MLAGVCVAMVACSPTANSGGAGGQTEEVASWKNVEGVSKKTSATGGELVAKVDGREVVAVIKWRPYNPASDGSVSKWYGDMGSPPPAYVVDSLVLAIDGKGVPISKSKYRNLCSKWMNQYSANPMSLHQDGKKLRLVVGVGDGAESWAAVYVFDPATGGLLSHSVEDGVMVSNQVAQ